MKPILLPLLHSDLERFDENLPHKPAEPELCWQWKHGQPAASYRFWLQGETRYPHIVAWFAANGDISAGLQVLRTCGNPRCCRTTHMTLGKARQTTNENLAARFFAKTRPGLQQPHMDTPCLEWIGSGLPTGYGVMNIQGKQKKATHVAWFIAHGEWPPADEVVMHKCDHPKCVNIEHLERGSRADNRADCVQKGRQAKGQTHGSQTKPESVPKGERSGRAKITTAKVIQIRLTLLAHPNVHGVLEGLARKFNLDASTVRAIAEGSLWGHVHADALPGMKPIPLSQLQFGHKKGEKSPFAKISDATIKLIREEYAGAVTKWGVISKLAKKFKLSPGHVHRIVKGQAR
jgi:hypothetical protein